MGAECSLAEWPEWESGAGRGCLAENTTPPEPALLRPFAERVFQALLCPPLGLTFKQREKREWHKDVSSHERRASEILEGSLF